MFEASNLGLFITASLVLLLVPGPAVLYIVARSAEQGRRAGLVSVAGIHLGTLVHIGAAVIGLSAVIASSAQAFTVVKFAGAGYLIYLGIQAMREGRAGRASAADVTPRSLRRLFWDGALVNALNPKTAVFFLAFVPQFISPTSGSVTIQLVVLGLLFVAIGLITDGAYALAGGAFGGWLRTRPRVGTYRSLVSGVTYMGLGVAAALGETPD